MDLSPLLLIQSLEVRWLVASVVTLGICWLVVRLLPIKATNRTPAVMALGLLCLLGASSTAGISDGVIFFLESTQLQLGSGSVSLWALLKGTALVGVFVWIATLALRRFESEVLENERIHPSARILVGKIVRILVLSIVSIWALSLAGVDVAMLAIFGGTIAVGAAFGLQNVISNLFCGILLLMDRSIKPGDVIGLQDGKIYGVVNCLNARYVSIRSREGREYLIPNEFFITNKVENWSYSNRLIRCSIPFRVQSDADLQLVERILVQEIGRIDRVLLDPEPAVRFRGIQENWVDLEVRFWIGDPENGWSGIRSTLVRNVLTVFRSEGVGIPLKVVCLEGSMKPEPVA